MKKVAITGGCLSQNMGAAAMGILVAEYVQKAGFDVVFFSKYPKDDKLFSEKYHVPIRASQQIISTFLLLPMLAVATCIPGGRKLIRNILFKDIILFYDIGGITFSRHRGISGFLINLTWLLLPLLLKVPVIKGSQAIGPLDTWYLQRFAVPLLKSVSQIYSRGERTVQELAKYHIASIKASDLAFLLQEEKIESWEEKKLLHSEYVTIIPSSVIMKRYDTMHGKGSYICLLRAIINELSSSGLSVYLLAHSYRPSSTLINNDYPICQELFRQISAPQVKLINVFGKTPGNLKYIIARSRLVITGRFHGMIASLSSGIPVVVTSWSDKYVEVLDEFELSEFAISWKDLNRITFSSLICQALKRENELKNTIASHLPGVIESAELNFSTLTDMRKLYEESNI